MNIWRKALAFLDKGERIVVLKVLWHKGSSPGKQGFEMLVTENSELLGSIGGGRTEFQLVERAKKMLDEGKITFEFKKEVHRDGDENSSGMICAGEQWVVLMPITSTDKPEIEKIVQNNGSIEITPQSLTWKESLEESNYLFDYQFDSNWKFVEKLNQKSLLYIVGGGHVGLATAKLFQDLDFEVTLFDDRKGLNTFEQDLYSDEKKIIDYENIANEIQRGNQTYLIILTHNFKSDALVLARLQNVQTKYIGVLGSKSKIKSMFHDMKKNGVSGEFLTRIDAPIGLSINSITPAEIAVSIAAKIISLRNAKD